MIELFKIRKEERWPVAILALAFAILSGLIINCWWDSFTQMPDNMRSLMVKTYHFSGFDPLTMVVVTDWFPQYNVHRHPFLAFFFYPFYLLNQLLMSITGINCAAFIIWTLLLISTIYSFVYIYRILKEVVGIERWGSIILAYFLFSFAYVMASQLAPDHFAYSLTMLLMTLYVAGTKMRTRQMMKKWETVALFFVTAGITLNNGLKVFMAQWFVNGKRFFRPLNLLLAVILPSLLIWQFCQWEYKTWVWPKEMERYEKRVKKQEADQKNQERLKKLEAQMKAEETATSASDTTKAKPKVTIKHYKNFRKANQGVPIKDKGFLSWTDIKTDRWKSFHSNLFGESLQLHQQYLLKDGLYSRPVFVDYDYIHNYIVEGIIVMLFLIGVWCGRHSRFLWMAMSFFALDLAIHVVLGFALNEVYIMTNHWAYVIPIAIAYIAKALAPTARRYFYLLMAALTLFLFIHNIHLICTYVV